MLPFIFRWIELYAIIRAVVERSITPTVQASVSIVRGPSLYVDRKSNIFPRSSQAISSPEEASPSAPGSILTTTEASPFSKRTKAPFGDLQRYCEAVVDESLRLFEEEADEAVEEFLPQLSQMLLGCTECLVSCFIVDSRRVAPKNQCASGYGEDTLEIKPGNGKVVIVDDVYATGGTMGAVEELCKKAGYEVIDKLCLIDLLYLHNDIKCKSLVQYE